MRTIVYNSTLVTLAGNESFLYRRLTTFLVSRNPAYDVVAKITEWVYSLVPEEVCVMCGDTSPIERDVVDMLLDRGVPTILVVGRTLRSMGTLDYWTSYVDAINDGRMLLLSPIDEIEKTKLSVETMQVRNEWMIRMAHEVVVGYVKAKGNLAHQLQGYEKVRILDVNNQCLMACPTESSKIREHVECQGKEVLRRLQCEELGSYDMRKELYNYLKLPNDRPSTIHSEMLSVVLERYATLPDFDFTSFFRMWDWRNLRDVDYEAVFRDNRRQPSLAERSVERLMNVMPVDGCKSYNGTESFDAVIVHNILFFLLRVGKNDVPVLRLAQRLALYEHDVSAAQYYDTMIDKEENKKGS